MTPGLVIHIVREMFFNAFWVSAPLLLIGFSAAVVMSLIQIVTSIQDAAFSAIPRIVVFLGALLLLMPWMLSRMMSYSISVLGDLGRYAR